MAIERNNLDDLRINGADGDTFANWIKTGGQIKVRSDLQGASGALAAHLIDTMHVTQADRDKWDSAVGADTLNPVLPFVTINESIELNDNIRKVTIPTGWFDGTTKFETDGKTWLISVKSGTTYPVVTPAMTDVAELDAALAGDWELLVEEPASISTTDAVRYRLDAEEAIANKINVYPFDVVTITLPSSQSGEELAVAKWLDASKTKYVLDKHYVANDDGLGGWIEKDSSDKPAQLERETVSVAANTFTVGEDRYSWLAPAGAALGDIITLPVFAAWNGFIDERRGIIQNNSGIDLAFNMNGNAFYGVIADLTELKDGEVLEWRQTGPNHITGHVVLAWGPNVISLLRWEGGTGSISAIPVAANTWGGVQRLTGDEIPEAGDLIEIQYGSGDGNVEVFPGFGTDGVSLNQTQAMVRSGNNTYFRVLASGTLQIYASDANMGWNYIKIYRRAHSLVAPGTLVAEAAEDVLIDVEGADNTLYPFAGGLTYAQVKATYAKLKIYGHASWSGTVSVWPYFIEIDLSADQSQLSAWMLYRENEFSAVRQAFLDVPADGDLGFRFQHNSLDSPFGGRMTFKVVGVRAQFNAIRAEDAPVPDGYEIRKYTGTLVAGLNTTIPITVPAGKSVVDYTILVNFSGNSWLNPAYYPPGVFFAQVLADETTPGISLNSIGTSLQGRAYRLLVTYAN